ncbi:hypothetical protein [Streptomyces sp. NPDC060205]|uniref:hypothetical protein n=1 Tax=Streptomyces sp. NPDC060205 TaxID=3347072 RepID=UPI0036500EF7
MPSPTQSPPTDGRPRALVIDRAWRALGARPGLESLSGPGGAPLTRTVKLIVLPLIIRPALRPELAADFLGARESTQLGALIRESAALLHATAQWFTVLKKTRRTLGITAGHPQDLYFQRCFELATEHGTPAASTEADALARSVVEDIADAGGGRTVEALKEYLDDDVRRTRLDGRLADAWGARTLVPNAEAGVATFRLAAEVLDACAAPGPGGDAGGDVGTHAGSSAFAVLRDAGHGSLLGQAVWTRADGIWGRAGLPAHLGLSAHPVPLRPEVGRGASTATLPAPFDRTLYERLFTVLQASAHREELPTVPELVRREVGRSCAPLGLYDESLRVAVVLGGRLAVGLDPLGLGQREHDPLCHGETGPGRTAAHRVVNGRWQREAAVLRARRMTVSSRPDPDGGRLSALAQDLLTPWVAYMRRLWVRLHGRDVRDAALPDAASAWTLLDGVARSVMMDHRAKVRTALRALSTRTATARATAAPEPRSA